MENENTPLHDETSVAAATPQNTGKGRLLAEIVMGFVGGIASSVLSHIISTVVYFLASAIQASDSPYPYFIVNLLVSIPVMAEWVRFGGKLTGGHGKRKGCYIGTGIVVLLQAVCVFLFVKWLENPTTIYEATVGIFLWGGQLIPVLAGAIIGYRKDAA